MDGPTELRVWALEGPETSISVCEAEVIDFRRPEPTKT